MPLVPEDMEEALNALGIELGRSDGVEVYGICPGHFQRAKRPDLHPTNWSVRRDTGEHYCFSCGYRGKFPSLVQDVLGLSRWDALVWIRRQGAAVREVDEHSSRAKELPQRGPRISEARFLSFNDPPDWALAERHISRAASEHFGVKWDPDNEAWLLPIRQADGTLIGWQRKSQTRRYFGNYPRGVKKAYCVFGLQQIVPGESAVLVESPLDCLRIYTVGIAGAVSGFGVEVSDAQMGLILGRTDTLISALDNDDAGQRVTRVLCSGDARDGRQSWLRQFRSFRIWSYPDGVKDPGDETDEQILASYHGAKPAALVKGMVNGVHRAAPAVPGGVPRRNGRLRAAVGRAPAGRR